jgi:hypothetical protein
MQKGDLGFPKSGTQSQYYLDYLSAVSLGAIERTVRRSQPLPEKQISPSPIIDSSLKFRPPSRMMCLFARCQKMAAMFS